MQTSLPEPTDIKALHEQYQLQPEPAKLAKIVDTLKPTIDYALSSVQAHDDPFMRSNARVIAGKAVLSYDPTQGASIPTWVGQQLQQLHRLRRQSQGAVKLPDRSILDAGAIHRAEAQFTDRHNREPDVHELADEVGMSVKRIQDVRRQTRAIPSPGALGDMPLQSGLVEEDPLAEEATAYVHKDSDYLDRKILEMKTGYGGKYEPLEAAEVGQRLGLTPSQLSRRAAKLSLKIHDIHQMLQEVTR